ncbi:unnamed protein product [Symbiodinium sp. CCMP2456]|nr:unnamed protein product [Symbiodinium sp. CCMP2456]
MMSLSELEVLSDGAVNVLALSWPDDGRTAPLPESLAIPVLKRQEGVLLCIPCGFLSLSLLDQGDQAEAVSLVGPSHLTRVPFGVTDEQGLEVPLDLDGAVTLVDFGADVLPLLRMVGEGFAAENLFPFLMDHPDALPLSEELLSTAKAWCSVSQLSALLPQISEQLASMREKQEGARASFGQASCVGWAASSDQDPFQAALLQQSQALSSLVSHLVSQQDGGLGDLTGPSSSTSIGAKGAARREKLQAALAGRTGGFFLAVVQLMSKRLHPTSPVPASLEDCSGQVSMCNYLERFGGFAGHRESGYLMWCLGHVMDCLINQDVAGAQEHLALTCVALDQSILDRGRWDFAWLLTLLEEPPSQLFHGRGMSANPRTRAFSPLSPVAWTTCALQFLKEVDLITTRRCAQQLPTRPPPGIPRSGASLRSFGFETKACQACSAFGLGLSDPFAFLWALPELSFAEWEGLWDPEPYLSDELYMAFRDPSQVAELARLWDGLGLLRLAPSRLVVSEAYLLSRAFNCYKAPDRDRMIIDRRGQNFAECKLAGPSLFIPVAPMLGMLEADPKYQSVYCAATDRKDFYHQLKISGSRAAANAIGPALPRSSVCSLEAFSSLLPPWPDSRETRADCLLDEPPEDDRDPLLFEAGHYLVCFSSVAQGDQLGVEFGTEAHGSLLESRGLLGPSTRISSNKPFKGSRGAQGLVIDDFFSVSVHDDDDLAAPDCLEHLAAAKAIYATEGLEGSDDKDIRGLTFAKIAGGELNSSSGARSQGLITVAAPASKRVALSVVTLEAARFHHITDVLLLSLYGLSRAAAQELVLMSVLSPLAASEISAPLSPLLFATDASEHKGGFVVAEVGVETTRPLWRTASKKGGYSRLWSKEESILAKFDDREPLDLRLTRDSPAPIPSRPLAFFFDFIEVGVANGDVTGFLADRGYRVGPIVSIKESQAYDMMQLRTLEWLIHLVQHGKLKSFLCWPPVATFAFGAWPSWRTLSAPKGRRWASNWSRLVCLVLRVPPSFRPELGWRFLHRSSRLFDPTLGFPGEGPFFRVLLFWVGVHEAVAVPSHGLRPRNSADEKRSRIRAAITLCEGRPVEPITQRRRDKLLEAFSSWLCSQEIVFAELLDLQPQTTRRLNGLLVRYGRELFEAGWPYSHYSEVINAISGKEPALRRNLQPAWDLAFAWLREEPHSHHVALPWQILLALITTAIMWGWPRVAGMLALTWGALMRVGETLAARRRDLLLPSDVGDTMSYGLVSIQEPKTRFRAARHQSARIDQPDLLAVVKLAFGHLTANSKLWPYSASTLRSRFDTLVKTLKADTWEGQGSKSLDLGSLRAGGATWLLQSSEDSELVRRRGRWLNSRTMEIYIQEISSLQFLNKLSLSSRQLILSLLDSFAEVLHVAVQLQLLHTPTSCWYARFSVG